MFVLQQKPLTNKCSIVYNEVPQQRTTTEYEITSD